MRKCNVRFLACVAIMTTTEPTPITLFNSDTSAVGVSNESTIHSQLFTYYQLEYYLIVCQLIIGLAVNIAILCSILLNIRQHNLISSHHINHHAGGYKCTTMPVVDIIIAILCCIATLRIISRCALQLVCYYGKDAF